MFSNFKRTQPVKFQLPFQIESYHSLLNEFQILHLLYHRNVNQHRVATWWKYFNLFHRHLRKVLNMLEDIFEIINTRKLTIIQFNNLKKSWIKVHEIPQGVIKRKSTKKNGKKVIKQLRFSQELKDEDAIQMLESLINKLNAALNHLYKHIIPPCYHNFMNIIQLGQFANLGFTLVGLLSKVRSVIEEFDANRPDSPVVKEKTLKSEIIDNATEDDGVPIDDIGEPLAPDFEEAVGQPLQFEHKESVKEPLSDFADQTTNEQHVDEQSFKAENNITNTSKKDKKDKKSKKSKKKAKAKSAIDDIFGF